jgi:DNA-binding CsgD family transcriptional regulator
MAAVDIRSRFSPVELEVLEGITAGISQGDLAKKLQIDVQTVRQLAAIVMAKLQAAIPKT